MGACMHMQIPVMEVCSIQQCWPWTSARAETLDTDGHQLQSRIHHRIQRGKHSDKLSQSDSPVNAWNFVVIDPIPFALQVPCFTQWTSRNQWERERERPWEQAPEVRIQLQVKGTYSSQLSEWVLARPFTYLRPPFYPFFCYPSHLYADCPQGFIHIWISKSFTSNLSPRRICDGSYTELNQRVMLISGGYQCIMIYIILLYIHCMTPKMCLSVNGIHVFDIKIRKFHHTNFWEEQIPNIMQV